MPMPRSSLALLERPGSFVLQQRPNLPGKLAYPGKIHFFGGGLRFGEDPYVGLGRELPEELAGFPPLPEEERLLWEGPYVGEDKTGEHVERYIYLFGVAVDQNQVVRPTQAEGGGIVEIPKFMANVQNLERQDLLTPFAVTALRSYIESGFRTVQIGE